MQKGIVIFVAGTLLGLALVSAAVLALPEDQKQMGGMLLLLAFPIPLVMTYVAHRATGATGNPFRGLSWGHTSWYFLTWLGAIALGLVAAGLVVGLGMATLDPNMTDYKTMFAEQAAQGGGGGQDVSGIASIMGYVTLGAGPTIGALFLTLLVCLSTFPWLGWLYRRLLVRGVAAATITLALLWALGSAVGGVAENPQFGELPVGLRIALSAVAGAASVPALVWIFLRTRSAVLPALATATYSSALGAVFVVMSDVHPLLAGQLGLVPSALQLLAGIALWVWKDASAPDLAVAAVASDGTPLTPEQLAALQGAPATVTAG
jgi:hypothetical protein